MKTDHEIEIHRELPDGSEVTIRCLVEVTIEGTRWTRHRGVTADYAACGLLPDGSLVDLTADEEIELDTFARDVQDTTRSRIGVL